MSTTDYVPPPANPQPAAAGERDQVDPEALEQFVLQVVVDAGGALVLPLALIGDRLGLFAALRDAGPSTSAELADRTGLSERYLREWLRTMAAAGYVVHEGAESGGDSGDSARQARYRLNAAQAEAFTNPDSPGYVAGALQNLTAATRMTDRLTEAFRTGEGIPWHEQHEDMFEGTERFFRPGYVAHLVPEWIPAMTGIRDRLAAGGRVADVGCGLGASTILMAEAFPATTFDGVDYHAPSIELNPLGKVLSGASMLVCLPSGLSDEPRTGLGNQAGPARTMQLAREAGFSDARVATSTDFNLVYELTP
jgi:hypothetical protein